MTLLIAEAAEIATTVLGLTVVEWLLVLPMIAAMLGVALKVWLARKEGKDWKAIAELLVDSLEEVDAEHPQAVKIVKTLIRDKATKAGLQTRLHAEKEKATEKFRKMAEEKDESQ